MVNRSFTCPHCHSDNIQSFEMVYSNGVSTSTHSTIGVGFAGRFGVGTATTNSTSVTNLSQSVAPPEKKSYIKFLARHGSRHGVTNSFAGIDQQSFRRNCKLVCFCRNDLLAVQRCLSLESQCLSRTFGRLVSFLPVLKMRTSIYIVIT